jgi:hypothetical protein
MNSSDTRLAYFGDFIENQCVVKSKEEIFKAEKKTNNKRDFPDKSKNAKNDKINMDD